MKARHQKHLATKMLALLELSQFGQKGERYISYSEAGHFKFHKSWQIPKSPWNFSIRQMCPYLSKETGANAAGKTMFLRNDELHRIDGPAYIFKGIVNTKEKYYVDGQEYNKNEFNFFVTGMAK